MIKIDDRTYIESQSSRPDEELISEFIQRRNQKHDTIIRKLQSDPDVEIARKKNKKSEE